MGKAAPAELGTVDSRKFDVLGNLGVTIVGPGSTGDCIVVGDMERDNPGIVVVGRRVAHTH